MSRSGQLAEVEMEQKILGSVSKIRFSYNWNLSLQKEKFKEPKIKYRFNDRRKLV